MEEQNLGAVQQVQSNQEANDAKLIVEAFKGLSALATSRWCRVHLLGGFARPKDAQTASNAARTKEREAAMAIKTSQKSEDSIVARAAKVTGVVTKEAGRKALYWVGKSINLVPLATSQFAMAAHKRGTLRSDQDTWRATRALLKGGRRGLRRTKTSASRR